MSTTSEESDVKDFSASPSHTEDVQDREDRNFETLQVLPDKSRERYEKEYNLFKEWCNNKNIHEINENATLAYFSENAAVLKSSSMWSKYSMLKTTMAIKDKIDIKSPGLLEFLKRLSAGYVAEKAKTFTREEVTKFITEAPDSSYLMMKVCLVVGVAGGCRCDELTKMKIDDIQDKDSVLIIKIPNSPARSQRTFIVTDETVNGVNILEYYRKYAALRPPKTEHRRFFVNYNKGKCSIQVVGKNTVAKIPKEVAKYLQLPDIEAYTGQSFRRTAAMLVDTGGSFLSRKRPCGWRSSTSEMNKRHATQQTTPSEKPFMSSESSVHYEITDRTTNATTLTNSVGLSELLSNGIRLNNLTNCIININVNIKTE